MPGKQRRPSPSRRAGGGFTAGWTRKYRRLLLQNAPMRVGAGLLSLALAMASPRAARPQGVAITDTGITVAGDEVLTTGEATILYVRGTGANNPANRLVRLGETVLVDDADHGLTLTVLDVSSQSVQASSNYATATLTSESNALAEALDAMHSDQFGVLTSYGAFEENLTPSLRTAAARVGLWQLATTPVADFVVDPNPGFPISRVADSHPYAAVFYGSSAPARSKHAIEIMQSRTSDARQAILVTWLSHDGFIGQSAAPAPPRRYVERGDGTVWDSWLSLLFLQDASCGSLAGTDANGNAHWAVANAAAASLADGTCGLTDGSVPGDWRLPTKTEWEQAIALALTMGCTNTGPGGAPSIANDFDTNCHNAGPSSFFGVQSLSYWSSTEVDTDNAWFAGLLLGQVSPSAKALNRFVWPVRALR